MNSFLLATDSTALADEIRDLLALLLRDVALEVVHEDGRLALARVRSGVHRLAFLPLEMRNMEALTLLRALGGPTASRVVLLTPETLSGFRVAWEGLRMGARDMLCTRGRPATRLKGQPDSRARQLAQLLDGEAPLAAQMPDRECWDRPWVILPETRHLLTVAELLRDLPREFPIVLRVPEGPRLRRVIGEEFARASSWPVRALTPGDQLLTGQVHLFAEPEIVRIEPHGFRWIAQVSHTRRPSGSWAAREELLTYLGDSSAALGILSGEWMDETEEDLVCANPDAERELQSIESPDSSGHRLTLSLESGRAA